ncbi:MAG: hypothetical protein ABI474_00015 [Actinomycetota bacterium]
MDLSGDITTAARFDDQGRSVESRQPSATGTDAGTVVDRWSRG